MPFYQISSIEMELSQSAKLLGRENDERLLFNVCKEKHEVLFAWPIPRAEKFRRFANATFSWAKNKL